MLSLRHPQIGHPCCGLLIQRIAATALLDLRLPVSHSTDVLAMLQHLRASFAAAGLVPEGASGAIRVPELGIASVRVAAKPLCCCASVLRWRRKMPSLADQRISLARFYLRRRFHDPGYILRNL